MPEPTPSGPSDLPPTGELKTGTLGRYKIIAELGRGGCGIVYRAQDPSIGRTVAIKTILAKTESSSGQESRERFRREARSAGNLSHPNIVTVHDFNDSGDPMFIAMEYVEGTTLAHTMSSGPLPMDFILGVLRSAADALDYAHAQHIIHRDIKPANFLINKNGRLKITDFGIAKILDSEDGLTSTGTVVGTVQYMSPEQISETHVTGRSDQFSLAVIAYEMLTGVKPFPGNSWASVIHAIIMAEPPPITKFRENLSESANVVLRKALAKDPESRFASCTEFFQALEHALLGSTIEKTAVYTKTQSGPPVPTLVEHGVGQALNSPPSQSGPGITRDVTTQTTKAPTLKPVLVGALGGILVAAGLWFGLRSRTTQSVAPVTREEHSAAQNPASPGPVLPAAPLPESRPKAEPTPVPHAAGNPVKQAKEIPSPAKSITPAQPSSPPEKPKVQAPPTVEIATATPPQPVAAPPRDVPPAPTPAPAPPRVQDDQAKRAMEEQTRRTAEEQTRRAADEQAKRAAADQAKRLADEQAKNARTAEFDAISLALRSYKSAYERKDLTALQAIWPSIPKPALEGIRGSFRDASEVTMDLRTVSDPKISGATATVVCDRSLRQVILKRVLQASGRVRIVLIRTGASWTIQSVEPVSQ